MAKCQYSNARQDVPIALGTGQSTRDKAMSKNNPKYEVVEGVSGHWYYHLAPQGKTQRALCGAATMHCYLSIKQWGTKGHLNEKYCSKCYELSGYQRLGG